MSRRYHSDGILVAPRPYLMDAFERLIFSQLNGRNSFSNLNQLQPTYSPQ